MKKNLAFLGFLLTFHLLFWQQGPGLNLSLFTLASVVWFYANKPFSKPKKLEVLLASSFLICSFSHLLINSYLSTVMSAFTFITFYSYLHLRNHSVAENFVNGALAFFSFRNPILPAPLLNPTKPKPAGLLYTRLIWIPLLFFVLYFIMFLAGNPIFKDLSETAFGRFFKLFENISWPYFFFTLLSLIVVRWLFLKKRKNKLNLSADNTLVRTRAKGFRYFRGMELKHEYLTALILFALLNVLFVTVNFIDIKWIWFQFEVPTGFSLKDFLHDGVLYLILSLLLSMVLVFYFFRKNLNFYPNNVWLKRLALFWVFQNGILAISVIIRSFYYIGFHGLASGRIGVLVFLTLVFFGLVSLAIKISTQKNSAFVLRINSAFALILLSVCTTVNWDGLIANVNLNHAHANEIDVNNYLNLNPQVYPIIFANLDKVETQIRQHNNNDTRWISYDNIDDFKERLLYKSERYLNERAQYRSFNSWTWADAHAQKQLTTLVSSNKGKSDEEVTKQ